MDCDKFDQNVVEAVYGELDEVTELAMRRHAEGCARCRALESGLQTTVEVGTLPLVEPSPDLEDRILRAARAAARPVPTHRRLLRAVSWIGSHAMRPQLAMAALLMLVLGSSLLLLRARPGTTTPVSVADRGVPHTPQERNEAVEAPALPVVQPTAPADEGQPAETARGAGDKAPTPVASASDPGADVFNRGLANYRAGNHQVAQQDFEEAERQGGPTAPSAALFAARAVRSQNGCGAAVPYYNSVRERYAATPASADAAWEQANCYQTTGNVAEARKLWSSLRNSETYRLQAEQELAANAEPVATTTATAMATAAGGANGGKVAAPAPVATTVAPGGGANAKAAAPEQQSPYSSSY